jgi:ABC-type transport system involved in cytochrome bd biosynthesis fused ATPase/permease subunit
VEAHGTETPYADAPPADERRRGTDRRDTYGRRAEDRARRVRDIAATLLAFCGGLAVLYLFFAAIGAVDLGEALVFTIAAGVLAILWLVGAWQRSRSGGAIMTRPDRERRGF